MVNNNRDPAGALPLCGRLLGKNATIIYIEIPPEITKTGKTYLSPHERKKAKLDIITKTLDKTHGINITQDRDYSLELTSLFCQLNQDVEIHVSKPTPACKDEVISLAHDSLFGGHYTYDKRRMINLEKYSYLRL